MSSLTCVKPVASLQCLATHSHLLSRVSQFCLYYEWMASLILAVVVGSNQWCLAPAEITGVTGDWAHEFSNAGSLNVFERFPQYQIYCRIYQGVTEWLSSLWSFKRRFHSHGLPMPLPPADLQEVVISPHALVPLCAGGGSAAWCLVPFYKEKIIFICHSWKGTLVLPPVGMATRWHPGSPLSMTASA